MDEVEQEVVIDERLVLDNDILELNELLRLDDEEVEDEKLDMFVITRVYVAEVNDESDI